MMMVMGMMMMERVVHRSVFHLLRLNLYPNVIRISDDFTCHMFTITKRTTTPKSSPPESQNDAGYCYPFPQSHEIARKRQKSTRNTQPIVVRFYDAFFCVCVWMLSVNGEHPDLEFTIICEWLQLCMAALICAKKIFVHCTRTNVGCMVQNAMDA